jgi:RND family efflux transporter MFP subunit
LKRGYLPEEIAAARQDAANAQATVDGLRNELTALKDLLDRNEISSVIYDTKSKALESAEAAMAAAQERAKLLEAGTRPEMIAEAQALLDAAQADVEQAELALQWCSITSPIHGVVVQLLARQGQFFDKAVPLARIIDLSEVFVQLRIPSRDFAKVTLGSQVEVSLDSLLAQKFHGTIERISGEADPLTGNVVVFALVKNTDRLLRPGLSCHAQVSLPAITNSLVVPIAAVADHSGTTVVTVIRDGKAYETVIEIGTKTQESVEVVKGLSNGELVATAGGTGLPEGCPVKVVADLSAARTDGN